MAIVIPGRVCRVDDTSQQISNWIEMVKVQFKERAFKRVRTRARNAFA
jgi:hypothetical protein